MTKSQLTDAFERASIDQRKAFLTDAIFQLTVFGRDSRSTDLRFDIRYWTLESANECIHRATQALQNVDREHERNPISGIVGVAPEAWQQRILYYLEVSATTHLGVPSASPERVQESVKLVITEPTYVSGSLGMDEQHQSEGSGPSVRAPAAD